MKAPTSKQKKTGPQPLSPAALKRVNGGALQRPKDQLTVNDFSC